MQGLPCTDGGDREGQSTKAEQLSDGPEPGTCGHVVGYREVDPTVVRVLSASGSQGLEVMSGEALPSTGQDLEGEG